MKRNKIYIFVGRKPYCKSTRHSMDVSTPLKKLFLAELLNAVLLWKGPLLDSLNTPYPLPPHFELTFQHSIINLKNYKIYFD